MPVTTRGSEAGEISPARQTLKEEAEVCQPAASPETGQGPSAGCAITPRHRTELAEQLKSGRPPTIDEAREVRIIIIDPNLVLDLVLMLMLMHPPKALVKEQGPVHRPQLRPQFVQMEEFQNRILLRLSEAEIGILNLLQHRVLVKKMLDRISLITILLIFL